MTRFSERLKLLRNGKYISQQNLADIIGISKSSINMYERGEREPSLETLEAIADYFNVDMDYLIGRQEIKRKITLSFDASTREVKVITAYHNKPQKQSDVDKILEIEPDDYERSTQKPPSDEPYPEFDLKPTVLRVAQEPEEYK